MQPGPGPPQPPGPRVDGQQPTPSTSPRPAIAIPSFREVQQAQRTSAAPPILFRPSNAGASPGSAPMPSSMPPAAQTNPLAFIHGGPPMQSYRHTTGNGPPAAAYHRPPSMAGPPAQYQQQQYYPPNPSSLQQYPIQQQQYQQRPPQQQQQQQQLSHPQRYGVPPLPPGHSQQHQPQQQSYPQQQQPGPSSMPPPVSMGNSGGPGTGSGPVNAPLPQINPNAITVSKRQQGNPLLKYIRNVRWQYGDIIPDYLLGQTTAALFLSLRYHLLKPEYVHSRMKELPKSYRLRVLLVHVDTEDAVEPLAQVTRAAIGNDFTLLCGFSNAECARYLETLKSYEKKPAETIQKDLGTDYVSRATAALTTVRGVNRTDVKTLGDRFGSMAAVMRATEAELKACPGVGPVKAKRLYETFHEPFRRNLAAPVQASVPAAQQQQSAQPPVIEQILTAGGDENDEDEENEEDALL